MKELFLRALLLIGAPWAWIISMAVGLQIGLSVDTANGLGILIALFIAYKAIIPWRTGKITIGDTINKWKDIGNGKF